jgi:hypothetical protein
MNDFEFAVSLIARFRPTKMPFTIELRVRITDTEARQHEAGIGGNYTQTQQLSLWPLTTDDIEPIKRAMLAIPAIAKFSPEFDVQVRHYQ